MQECADLSELEEYGISVSHDLHQEKTLITNLFLSKRQIIPDVVKTQLQSGKLSLKQMPKGQYFELLQDFISSCAIRAAREVYAVIPNETITVNVIEELLNKKTGHLENQIILSVIFKRQTIDNLNLNYIDPSEALSNFVHEMDFKKTSGFSAVKLAELEN